MSRIKQKSKNEDSIISYYKDITIPRLSVETVSINVNLSKISPVIPGKYSVRLFAYETPASVPFDKIGPIEITIASTFAPKSLLSVQIPQGIFPSFDFWASVTAYSHRHEDSWSFSFYADALTIDKDLYFKLTAYNPKGKKVYESLWISTDTDKDGTYGDLSPEGGFKS